MLPKSADTVTALASGPEHAGEHEERAERVANAAHTTILGVGVGPSSAGEISIPRPRVRAQLLSGRHELTGRFHETPGLED